jgi:hypothetical protein
MSKICGYCLHYNEANGCCYYNPPQVVFEYDYGDGDYGGGYVTVRPKVYEDDKACDAFEDGPS